MHSSCSDIMCQHLPVDIYLIIDSFVRLIKHWSSLLRNTMCFPPLMFTGPEWIVVWPHGVGDCARGLPKHLQHECSCSTVTPCFPGMDLMFWDSSCTFQSMKLQLRLFILCNSCKKEKKKRNTCYWKTLKRDVCKFFMGPEYRYICILLLYFGGTNKGRETVKKGRNI